MTDPVTALRAATPGRPIVDVTVGVLGVACPETDRPVFLRLETPAGDPVDRARARYLMLAAVQLQFAAPGWLDGPGLLVDAGSAEPAELYEVGQALRVLASEPIARSYLALVEGEPSEATPRPADDGRALPTEGGEPA
jgi:hypothetical protein